MLPHLGVAKACDCHVANRWGMQLEFEFVPRFMSHVSLFMSHALVGMREISVFQGKSWKEFFWVERGVASSGGARRMQSEVSSGCCLFQRWNLAFVALPREAAGRIMTSATSPSTTSRFQRAFHEKWDNEEPIFHDFPNIFKQFVSECSLDCLQSSCGGRDALTLSGIFRLLIQLKLFCGLFVRCISLTSRRIAIKRQKGSFPNTENNKIDNERGPCFCDSNVEYLI